MSLAECAAPLRIGLAGQFSMRADPAVPGSQAEQHAFAFEQSHASSKQNTEPAAAAAAASSSSATADAAAASPPPKSVRVTANTMATVPADIPRSCPTDPVLADLVTLIQMAQRESDRYLTALIDKQKALAPAAAAAANPNASGGGAKRAQKKRRNDDEGDGGDDEGAEATDEQTGDAGGDDEEKQNKKAKA